MCVGGDRGRGGEGGRGGDQVKVEFIAGGDFGTREGRC